MVVSGELDEFRVGDRLCHGTAASDIDPAITGAMQDESRHSDRRQDTADIDIESHLEYSSYGGRAGAEPEVLAPPSLESFVVGERWRPCLDFHRAATIALHPVNEVMMPLDSRRPRIVGRPDPLGISAVQHECRHAIGVGGGEQDAHRAPFGDTEQGGPLRARGVQHGSQIVHALLECWELVHWDSIREPGAALVKEDQTAERRQAGQETLVVRVLPGVFDVRYETRDDLQIQGSVPNDLIRDAVSTASGVPRCRPGSAHPRISFLCWVPYATLLTSALELAVTRPERREPSQRRLAHPG